MSNFLKNKFFKKFIFLKNKSFNLFIKVFIEKALFDFNIVFTYILLRKNEKKIYSQNLNLFKLYTI